MIQEEEEETAGWVPAIYVEPPDPAQDTDEFSGDEEDLGDLDVDHIPRRQLLAPAHFETQSDDDEEERVLEDSTTRRRGHNIRQQPVIKWKKGPTRDLEGGFFPPGDYTRYRDFQPHELFELFFDETL